VPAFSLKMESGEIAIKSITLTGYLGSQYMKNSILDIVVSAAPGDKVYRKSDGLKSKRPVDWSG